MTLDDAASRRQHASDLADADVVKTERLESYGSIVELQAAMLAALRAGDHERALVVFGDLTRLAVLAEREACALAMARFATKMHSRGLHDFGRWIDDEIAAAIRART